MEYVELIEKSFSGRGNIVSLDSIKFSKRDHMSFISVNSYDQSILNFVELNKRNDGSKSVKGYEGPVILRDLVFDVDSSEGIGTSIRQAKALIEVLSSNYDVDPYSMKVFYSGMKGFHVLIPWYLFMGNRYSSEHVGNVCRIMAASIVGVNPFPSEDTQSALKNEYGVDFTMYDQTRIIRTVMSYHPKSGRYKIPVDVDLVLNLEDNKVIDLSSSCKYEMGYKIERKTSKKLNDLFNDSIVKAHKLKQEQDNSGMTKVAATYKTSDDSIFKVPDYGGRNQSLYKMAYRLYAASELKPNEIESIVRSYRDSANTTSVLSGKDIIDEAEFKTIISSAYRRTRGMNGNSSSNFITAKDMTEQAISDYINSKHITTCIPEVDKHLGGGFVQGNYYPIIGTRGTKKSLIAQYICSQNAKNGVSGIYFNLEMSQFEWFNRLSMMLLDIDLKKKVSGTNYSKIVSEVRAKMDALIKDNLFVVNEAEGVKVETIGKTIESIQERTGNKIRYIVIDSMNSMDLPNPHSETMSCFNITKGLKQLAKDKYVAVIQLNHTNQACPAYLRDNSGFARGGGKIADNSDAFFSLSKIIDNSRSSGVGTDNEIIEYFRDLIWMRFDDKRGTGNIENKVLVMDSGLRFSVSEDSAQHTGFIKV